MKFFKKMLREEIPFILVAPALVWELLFLYFPLIVLIFYSVTVPSDISGKLIIGSLHSYREILSGLYTKMFFNSFCIAAITAILCLVLAYPISYYLAFKVKRLRTILLFFLILPSWTSLIVQVYAWFFLLEKTSVVSQFLYFIGVFKEPTHLLNNNFATIVGMVYGFLPFMIFPIYSAFEKIDRRLLEASADLGASKFQTLKHVVFPLSLPGVFAGSVLVFVPSFSEFTIPQLLGGSKYVLWGGVIVSKFIGENNFSSGAALAAVGVLFLLCLALFLGGIYVVYRWLVKRTHKISQPYLFEDDFANWGEFHGGD